MAGQSPLPNRAHPWHDRGVNFDLHPPTAMRRLPLSLLVTCALLASSACETPKETLVGEPPPKEEQTVSKRPTDLQRIPTSTREEPLRKAQKKYPEPLFGASTWPYVEEGTSFKLSWNAQPGELPVFEEPDPNAAIVDKWALEPGQEIPWRSSYVAVYKPKLFQAKDKVLLEGYRHAPESRERHDAPVSATVHPGQTIAVYLYAGGSTCYVGAEQTLMRAPCPEPHQFSGNFSGQTSAQKMHPNERIWWVYVETTEAAGWVPVDDRVLVDIFDE